MCCTNAPHRTAIRLLPTNRLVKWEESFHVSYWSLPRFGSVRFGSVRFDSIRLCTFRFVSFPFPLRLVKWIFLHRHLSVKRVIAEAGPVTPTHCSQLELWCGFSLQTYRRNKWLFVLNVVAYGKVPMRRRFTTHVLYLFFCNATSVLFWPRFVTLGCPVCLLSWAITTPTLSPTSRWPITILTTRPLPPSRTTPKISFHRCSSNGQSMRYHLARIS